MAFYQTTLLLEALDRNRTDTGGLVSAIKIKVNSTVMPTVNVDLGDKLVNDQLGTTKLSSKNLNGEVTKIYMKLMMQELVKQKLIKTLLQSNILRYQ